MRYFPWAETTEGITQRVSPESRTYSRTRCFGLQAQSQSPRAMVGLNVMIRVRIKAASLWNLSQLLSRPMQSNTAMRFEHLDGE